MILRGSSLSDVRQSLPMTSAAVEIVNAVGKFANVTIGAAADPNHETAPAFAPGLSAGRTSRDYQDAQGEASTIVVRDGVTETTDPNSQYKSTEPQSLTFESVVTWLAVQSAEIRNSCAAILATEVAGIYEKAKAEGVAEGKQLGLASTHNATANALSLLKSIQVAAELEFANQNAQLEATAVEVIAEAINKIAGPLLGTREAALGAVREILKRVRDGREVVVRVSRDDLETVRHWHGSLSEALGGRALEVLAGNRVELGGALVETKFGSLDGRLEVQLRELYETLRLAKSTAAKPLTGSEPL